LVLRVSPDYSVPVGRSCCRWVALSLCRHVPFHPYRGDRREDHRVPGSDRASITRRGRVCRRRDGRIGLWFKLIQHRRKYGVFGRSRSRVLLRGDMNPTLSTLCRGPLASILVELSWLPHVRLPENLVW